MIYILGKHHSVAHNFTRSHSLDRSNCRILTKNRHVQDAMQGVVQPLVITLGGWKRDRPLGEIDSIYNLLHSRNATITKVTDW